MVPRSRTEVLVSRSPPKPGWLILTSNREGAGVLRQLSPTREVGDDGRADEARKTMPTTPTTSVELREIQPSSSAAAGAAASRSRESKMTLINGTPTVATDISELSRSHPTADRPRSDATGQNGSSHVVRVGRLDISICGQMLDDVGHLA